MLRVVLAQRKFLVYNRRLCRGYLPRESPSTQQTDFSLRAVKMDGYVEGLARPKKVRAHNRRALVRGL